MIVLTMTDHVALAVTLLFLIGMGLGALFAISLFGQFIIPTVRVGSPMKVASIEGLFEITSLSANTSSYTADDSVALELHRKRV